MAADESLASGMWQHVGPAVHSKPASKAGQEDAFEKAILEAMCGGNVNSIIEVQFAFETRSDWLSLHRSF